MRRLLFLLAVALSGCSESVETTYGRMRGTSVNGTGAFAELLKADGHTVRTARRLTDELRDWADVVVRFEPGFGPPDADDVRWYHDWLHAQGGRRLIFVTRDYDAEADYWSAVREHLPKDATETQRTRAEALRAKAAKDRPMPFASKGATKPPAPLTDWFVTIDSAKSAGTCDALSGPWSSGIDAARAALPRRRGPKAESDTVLLKCDDVPLVVDRLSFNTSRTLYVANGSFLLNGALLNPARRPLARRAADCAGAEPRRVAFVEGSLLRGQPAGGSIFDLLKVPPFGWVMAQIFALGLAAALARAPRLGRAKPEPPSGEDRPVAHPEALGALLARTGQAADARAILESYRRWRGK